jgi:hypothetical protein
VKYFTPQLIAMGQTHDDRILDEQERLWDEAGDRYLAYLDTVRPQFPPGLRRIDASYYLHDAVVRSMGRHNHSLLIVLQLDTPPHSLLTFTYDLVRDPVIRKDVLPQLSQGSAHYVEWEYDEIEMIPGEPPTWAQSILLSNGWEVRLEFRDVQVQEAQALIPMPRDGLAGVVVSGVSQSS